MTLVNTRLTSFLKSATDGDTVTGGTSGTAEAKNRNDAREDEATEESEDKIAPSPLEGTSETAVERSELDGLTVDGSVLDDSEDWTVDGTELDGSADIGTVDGSGLDGSTEHGTETDGVD